MKIHTEVRYCIAVKDSYGKFKGLIGGVSLNEIAKKSARYKNKGFKSFGRVIKYRKGVYTTSIKTIRKDNNLYHLDIS